MIAYQWTCAPLTDEHGHVSGVTGVGRDVTDRKRAEEILRQRESEMRQLQKIEAIGRLAGGVAHDFNNVLTVVIGRCQLMLSRYQPDDPAYQDLDQIEATAQRAASLTRQLLAFSRNQATARQPLDLNATVTSVSDMLARLIGENIELAVDLDPKLDLVTADPGQIEQVIVNFADNARGPLPGGEETILLVEDEEAVRGLVREILSRLGYRVLVASNGIEALALSQRFPETIHLLLTDVIMPGMDGRELAERMMVAR